MIRTDKTSPIIEGLSSLEKTLGDRKSAWLPGADRKCADKMKEFLSTVEKTAKESSLDQQELKNVYTSLVDGSFETFTKGPTWFSTIRNFSSKVFNYFSKGGEFKSSWEIGEKTRSLLLSKCKPLELVQAQAQNAVLMLKKEDILRNISTYKEAHPEKNQEIIHNLEKSLKNPSFLLKSEDISLLQEEGIFPNGFSSEIRKKQEIALVQHCLKNKLFNELEQFSEEAASDTQACIEKYLPLFKGLDKALASKRQAENLRLTFIEFITESRRKQKDKIPENPVLKELFPVGVDRFILQSLLEEKCDDSIINEYKAILDSRSFFIEEGASAFIDKLFMRNGNASSLELEVVRGEVLLEKIDDLDRIDDAELSKRAEKSILSLELQKSSKKYSALLMDRVEEEIKAAQRCFWRSSKGYHVECAKKALDKFLEQSSDSRDGIKLTRQVRLLSDFLLLDNKRQSKEVSNLLPKKLDCVVGCLIAMIDLLPEGDYKNKASEVIRSITEKTES